MPKKKIWKLTVAIIAALGLVAAGVFIGRSISGNTKTASSAGEYNFIARRTQFGGTQYEVLNFVPLRKQLQTYFDDIDLKHSLYFEYLPTGTSIQINSDDRLASASLLKVPIAMDALKLVQDGHIDKNQILEIDDTNLDLDYGDLRELEPDLQLTLDEALNYMLKNSDNTALRLVEDLIYEKLFSRQGYGSSDVVDVEFSTQELKDSPGADRQVMISSKEYSSFFKCLYFACYLNFANSNDLLNRLTDTVFADRFLASSLPRDVDFAHKVGIYNDKQYRDCGIVYYGLRHYLLCVMIESNEAEANQIMGDVSEIVFNYVRGYGLQISQ